MYIEYFRRNLKPICTSYQNIIIHALCNRHISIKSSVSLLFIFASCVEILVLRKRACLCVELIVSSQSI